MLFNQGFRFIYLFFFPMLIFCRLFKLQFSRYLLYYSFHHRSQHDYWHSFWLEAHGQFISFCLELIYFLFSFFSFFLLVIGYFPFFYIYIFVFMFVLEKLFMIINLHIFVFDFLLFFMLIVHICDIDKRHWSIFQ